MKVKVTTSFLFCIIFLVACHAVTPYPTATISLPTLTPSTTPLLPSAISAPSATPTRWYTLTPETLDNYPTSEPAVLPTSDPRGDVLQLTPNVQRQEISFNELYVGKYVLRSWCNPDERFPHLRRCAVTISAKDMKQIEIWGYPAYIAKETGADLTGNGIPNIVIDRSHGGASTGPVTIVYEAGDTLEEIMVTGQDYRSEFVDLNDDGAYEYIVPIRFWSQFCVECQLWSSVVLEYQPQLGYVLATYKFKNVHSEDIREGLDFLEQFSKQNPAIPLYFPSMNFYANPSAEDKMYAQYANKDTDYTRAIRVLYNLVADYLLTGQQSLAQVTLEMYVPLDKTSEYLLGVQKDLQGFLAP
jgi:hypothetical protein